MYCQLNKFDSNFFRLRQLNGKTNNGSSKPGKFGKLKPSTSEEDQKMNEETLNDEASQFKAEKKNVILKLVSAELCEGLIPLAYAICFAMAYYGPNANLIGNVRNDYWHYKAVDDASWTFIVMFGMFAMDLVSFFLNAGIIRFKCNVNLFKETCIVLHKYWLIILLQLVNNTYHNFLATDVNLATAWTRNFDWLTSHYNVSTVVNSTKT